MKKIVGLLVLITFGISSFGQDTKAKAILDKVSNKISTYKTMAGDFEYIFENKSADVLEKSEGKFASQGDRYYVNILGVETFFDGKNVYSYMKDVEEVTISIPDIDSEDSLSPSNLFTIYKKGFDLKYVKETSIYNKKVHLINLLPKNKDRNYKVIEVYIDKSTNDFVLVKTIGKSGDDVSIRILDMIVNTVIPESQFVFDVASNPNVEVIDMR